MSGYNSIAAAFLFLLLLLFVSRTKVGYALLYYFVLSSILIVWFIGSPKIAQIFGG